MRNSVVLFLLLGVALAGPLAAQPLAPRPHPDVPSAMDVAGVHLVLNEEAQRLVQQKADGLCRHQPSFQARVDLADASFPIIDRILKEEGVPLDFRYLALQESALQGNARSNHEAVGYWQLKQETATGLGLVVNEAVDERQHLATSTRAAARYLTRSNASLHNWMNALLSYYTGLGGVKPYTLPTDFDATEMAITEATSPYVLMFLAQKVAFEPACGLNPKAPLLLQEFPAVAGQTLEAQALTLHADPAALATHNHWLLAAAVPADRPYTLIVPVGDVTQAAGIVANQRLQSKKELLAMPAVANNTAEVRVNNLRALIALPGETTADLARRAHQRLGEFLHHNELTAFDVAVTGRPYYLESKRDAAAVEYHVLQPGEKIFDVAQKYGMRQRAVLAKNRMSRVEELRPGRVLWLQHTRPREVAVEYRSLPEGVALERPTRAATVTETDVLIDRANEIATARREENPESGKVKVKIKVKNGRAETKPSVSPDNDGWGEVLSTATVAAANRAPAPPAATPAPQVAAALASAPEPTSTPVPASEPEPATAATPEPTPAPEPAQPATPAPRVSQLPPPAAAPAPAPLADEPPPPVAAPLEEAPAAPAEPTPPAPAAPLPSASRPVVVYAPAPKPAPVAKPLPAPPSPAEPAPRPAVVPAKPAPTPAPVVAAPKPAPVPAAKPATAPVVNPAAVAAATHQVAPHESVYSIARLYDIPPATLMALNNLAPPANLIIGQVLVLRPTSPGPVVATPAPISKPVSKPAASPAGQTNPALYVPKAAAPAPATSAPAAIQHTVAAGETLFSISKRYRVTVADLQAWNGKAATDTSAKIGEVLRVQASEK